MTLSKVELIARRRLVQAFINADYIKIRLSRAGEITKTAAGGKVRSPDTLLSEQKVALIPSKRRYDIGLINSEAGSIPETEYLILGNHLLDIEVNDEFTWLDQNYIVKGVHPIRRPGGDAESTLASVEFKGPNNG